MKTKKRMRALITAVLGVLFYLLAGTPLLANASTDTLEDGNYLVPIRAYFPYNDTVSMVEQGVGPFAKVMKQNGTTTMQLTFDSMAHYDFRGYVSHIYKMNQLVFTNGMLDSYTLTPAKVLSTHNVVDNFNLPTSPVKESAGIKYPKEVEIGISDSEEYVWLQLFIPAMAPIARGEQQVRIKPDYANSIELPYLSFSSKELTITQGEQRLLPFQAKGSTEPVQFVSANPNVVSVDTKGRIHAKAKGTTTITASLGALTATCKIIVKPEPTLSISDTYKLLYTKGASSFVLKATATGDSNTVVYGTNNKKVATVTKDGKVTAVGPGKAVITASANGKKKTCTVEVKKTSLSLNKSNVVLYTKGSTSVQLKARVVGPSNHVSYSSSNSKIVKIDKKGKLVAVKTGKAVITAKANGMTVKCKVTVKAPSIKVAKTTLTIKRNKTASISATATPSKKLSYKSSNKKIATVNSSGLVKGKKKGTTKITVSCHGISKTIKVKVV